MFAEKLKMSDGVKIKMEPEEPSMTVDSVTVVTGPLKMDCGHGEKEDVTRLFRMGGNEMLPEGTKVEKCVVCHHLFVTGKMTQDEFPSEKENSIDGETRC